MNFTEAAVVVAYDKRILFEHCPPGSSAVRIPDTRTLWDVLWDNRDLLDGVAHMHPGSGQPSPSDEDLTTFAAIDRALGRRLRWWIGTSDRFVVVTMMNTGGAYRVDPVDDPPWAAHLRALTITTPGGTAP